MSQNFWQDKKVNTEFPTGEKYLSQLGSLRLYTSLLTRGLTEAYVG